MSTYRRNVLVGITVLIALVGLGAMMLQFGAVLVWPFAPRFIDIQIVAERGDGLADGSPIFYRGVNVGRVRNVLRAPDDLRVIIDAQVHESPPLPANLRGKIRFASLLGAQSAIHLELIDPEPLGTLSPGDRIEAEYFGELVPPEFSELARELRLAAQQFRESNLINHLDQEVQQLGRVLRSVQDILDDEQMREDLKASLAGIRNATERADAIAGKLEQLSDEAVATLSDARGAIGRTETEILSLSRQFGDRLGQLSRLIEQFQSISAKVDAGDGTAGRLVNDPRLYEAMVDTAREMSATVSDLRRLVQQWEEEGLRFRLR